MLIKQFTAVGVSTGLLPKTVMRAVIEGTDLAIWRDSTGAVHAARNRCPHRGMRVSYGFVRDDRLVCPYHGWSYNGAGRCVFIPANPSVTPPKSYALRSFACLEQDGLIFVAEAGTPDGVQALGAYQSARTLFADVGIDHARRHIQDQAVSAAEGRADTFLLVSDGINLLVALQPMTDALTGLHVAIDRSKDPRLGNRLALDLRRKMEGLGSEVTGSSNTSAEAQANVN